jgi:hypothetical protein
MGIFSSVRNSVKEAVMIHTSFFARSAQVSDNQQAKYSP